MSDDLVFESTTTMTQAVFAEWVQLRERWDALNHFELLDGKVVMTPPAGYPHGRIEANVVRAVGDFVEARGLGQVFGSSQGYELPTGDTLEPDAAFVSNARWAAGPVPVEGRFLRIVPDLVVEILSRGTSARDRGEKRESYERAGVREYWMLDPRARTVTVVDWSAGAVPRERVWVEGEALRSAVLAGFEVAVSSLLALAPPR